MYSGTAAKVTWSDGSDGEGDGVGVTVDLMYAEKRLVALQCDHSTAHLTKEIHKAIVTEDVLKELQVTDMNLAVDLNNHR